MSAKEFWFTVPPTCP